MAANVGVSGTAVAAAAAGAFLVWAGIKDVNLVEGMRDLLAGKTPVGREQQRRANFAAGAGVAGAVGNAVGAVTGGPLVSEARKHLGARYVFGAIGPTVFDCSGLVVYCLRQTIDPKASRFVTQTWAAYARSHGWVKIARKDVQGGDVVWKSGHMGIAISNKQMIHAPHTGTVVKIGDIYKPDYMWVGWRRTASVNLPTGSIGKGAGML